MLLRCRPVEPGEHARAAPGRARHRHGVAGGVDDRDVARAAGRRHSGDGLRAEPQVGQQPGPAALDRRVVQQPARAAAGQRARELRPAPGLDLAQDRRQRPHRRRAERVVGDAAAGRAAPARTPAAGRPTTAARSCGCGGRGTSPRPAAAGSPGSRPGRAPSARRPPRRRRRPRRRRAARGRGRRRRRRRSGRACRRAPAAASSRPPVSTCPAGAQTARASGVSVTTGTRMSFRRACAVVWTTPARASAAAGATSSAHGSEPNRRCAAPSPAAVPGTATEPAPMWNRCTAVPNSTSKLSIGRTGRVRPSPGAAAKKSSRSTRPAALRCSRKPPPHAPLTVGSHTHDTSTAATSASHALPPRASTSAPARADSGCPAAMAPPARGGASSSRAQATTSPVGLTQEVGQLEVARRIQLEARARDRSRTDRRPPRASGSRRWPRWRCASRSNPVAITVTQTWSPRRSSTVAPKMMFAS